MSIELGNKFTNTFKLNHRNDHNTNKASYLEVAEFRTLHALSSYIFIYAIFNKIFLQQIYIQF
jgi:hypothetical protein